MRVPGAGGVVVARVDLEDAQPAAASAQNARPSPTTRERRDSTSRTSATCEALRDL